MVAATARLLFDLHPTLETGFRMSHRTSLGLLIALVCLPADADDWNQFRGPQRDNLSQEKGLLNEWSSGGPRQSWMTTGLGEGYSTVAVVGDRVYTMGNIDGAEHVIALDRNSGDILWKSRNGGLYQEQMGNGPRGTPTVIDDRVFALGGNGDLGCYAADSGDVIWQLNILQEFNGTNITWGISESVLIDDGKVICTPGGRNGTIVALDAKTGRTSWASKVPESPKAGYASPVIVEVGRVKQYVVFTSKGICGVNASNGDPLWGQDKSSNDTANCATPLVVGNRVFSSSDYGTGAELVELFTRGRQVSARGVYHTRNMKNHHGGMVHIDGYVYGSNGDILSCVDLKTGQATWNERSMKGAVVYADGKVVFRHENGEVVLLEANPREYVELSRFNQPNRSGKPAWSHPVISNGQLYLRDMDRLLVYDVK